MIAQNAVAFFLGILCSFRLSEAVNVVLVNSSISLLQQLKWFASYSITSATSDPYATAQSVCALRPRNCMYISVNFLERERARKFHLPLHGWNPSPVCGNSQPPRPEILSNLQFMHIPKTGTSINWALRGYFGCLSEGDEPNPCPTWLTNVGAINNYGLCDGRLLSCVGHVVSELMGNVHVVEQSNVFTMLRHPWSRLQSSFEHFRSNPSSALLAPFINASRLELAEDSIFSFITFPGINNCMTKMLNGFLCGQDIAVDENHLSNAKSVLSAMTGFGITEKFKESVCLFYWMYGGQVEERHLRTFRVGSYTKRTMRDRLSDDEARQFLEIERYDLALYDYALALFAERASITECMETTTATA